MLAAAVYLERVHGWDRVTARCASIPGAFSAVVVIASGSAADLPRVVLAQSIRIFTLVALMPAILALTSDGPRTSRACPADGRTVPEAVPKRTRSRERATAIAGRLAPSSFLETTVLRGAAGRRGRYRAGAWFTP